MRIISAKEFGNTVLAARKKAKLTQAQLAAESGVGERFVRELEKGKVTCQLEKSLLVAKMLGINLTVKLTDKKLKVELIPEKEVESRVWNFFNNALNFLEAFKILSPYPLLWQVGLTIGNHFIERFLKGILIWETKTLIHDHDLLRLYEKINSLEFDDPHLNILKKINAYFYFRYPETNYSLQDVLNEIHEESLPGIPRLPGEIGTPDLEEVINLGQNILEQLPRELRDIFDDAFNANKRETDLRKCSMKKRRKRRS